MSYLHINAPSPAFESCIVIDCPTCERPRRAFCAYYEWYGPSVTCAGCGERWDDGYQAKRPFARGWRDQARKRAIQNLARIGVKA